jgi:hypothetical protein
MKLQAARDADSGFDRRLAAEFSHHHDCSIAVAFACEYLSSNLSCGYEAVPVTDVACVNGWSYGDD